MLDRVIQSDALGQVAKLIQPGQAVRLTGMWASANALLATALGKLCDRPVLFLANHPDEADALADDIETFLKLSSNNNSGVHLLPAWETQLASDHISEEVTGQRLALLNLLAQQPDQRDKPVRYIVAPVLALLQPVPTPQALARGRLTLQPGQDQPPEALLAWLIEAGYERVDQVDQQGEFAHRGGIVDVFPPGANFALRVEYFGDQPASLRKFDLDTQRSTEPLEAYNIPAMRVLTSGETNDSREGSLTNLLEYLPEDTLCCMASPGGVRQLAERFYDQIRDDQARADSPVALRPVAEIFQAIEQLARVEMYPFAGQADQANSGPAVSMGIRSLERLSINTAEALDELQQLAEANEVWVFCDSPAESERFGQMLAEQYPELGLAVKLTHGHLAGGFHWPGLGLVAVGHHEIYHRYSKVRRLRKPRQGRPIESMLDLAEGDYVVHLASGIAKFEGLKKLDQGEAGEEYLRLKFADGAVLHVPTSEIHLVQKYIGSKGHKPKLSKLGGGHWARAKEKVVEAVQDLAAEMLRLQALRAASVGMSYPQTTPLQQQLAEEFLYTETPDQLQAIGLIDRDLARPEPMDRLICGDVGYGKTEIAMRAAMKIVEAGRQVALLVPTTVLAEQHCRTFTQRFADFPVNVEMLSRFRTAKQQREILHKLSLGQVDILIGTHRLLSKDVKFPDLGMVIIDEEQRFGVAAKEHLKGLRATVDVLTLTATPIPRTLHMALLGLRDICSLQTPPMDRRAIYTEVTPVDDGLLRAAILRELNRGGQVFFVHNRVHDIDGIANYARSLAGDAKVAIAHGQMAQKQLQATMTQFLRGQIDVLVCTTIIESGLDIPTANTMIINESDRFGLAELHQLRGRVGRYKHRAYCYLLLPKRRSVSPVAAKRLKAIEDFSDLGAGFQIAMRDLEIRGAGNILGSQQSGYIAAVGYELYCQLLGDSVRKLQGKPAQPRISVHIELGIEAQIPRSYIPSQRQRMEIYRRIVHCTSRADLRQLRGDLDDAFGKHPKPVDLLLDIAQLRIAAAAAGVRSIILMPPDVIFRVDDHRRAERVFQGAAGSVRLGDQKTLHWRPPKPYLEMPTLLRVLLRRFDQNRE